MIRRMLVLVGLLAAFVAVSACILDDDVDDFDFQLPDKTFQVNASELGLSTATSIQCDPANDLCGQVEPALVCDSQLMVCGLDRAASFPELECNQQNVCEEFGSTMRCDTVANACVAEADFELSAEVNLADEVPELQEVGNVTITKVTLKSLYVIVEINTFGVATPEMGVYAGPLTVTSVADPNVVRVGTIPSFAPGVERVDVVLTTDGRQHIEERLRTPNAPFKFFVHGVVELGPGDPLPDLWTGELKVVVKGEATASTAL